eukprot:TRINITY_DN25251_c0_g1_i1.p1 TRINITY_DN25251_c0_g1~~TRINITY_DN25251_c0_g1_i1.p1  ORF type:complete len:481 (+),score=49.45 TRINITY_DN25251_c0_g1_i1:63-1505(+)
MASPAAAEPSLGSTPLKRRTFRLSSESTGGAEGDCSPLAAGSRSGCSCSTSMGSMPGQPSPCRSCCEVDYRLTAIHSTPRPFLRGQVSGAMTSSPFFGGELFSSPLPPMPLASPASGSSHQLQHAPPASPQTATPSVGGRRFPPLPLSFASPTALSTPAYWLGSMTPGLQTPSAAIPRTPHYMACSPSRPSQRSPSAAKLSGASPMLRSAPAFPGFLASPTTPVNLPTVSTPIRPCARSKAREVQDDVATAIEEQSISLLRAALRRSHQCPGEHLLHEAARHCNLAAIRMLLQSKAEPNARCLCSDRGCEFPLQLLTCVPGFSDPAERLEAIELLLAAGASPHVSRTNDEANTPLHDAARIGDLEVARLLLRYGANPNATNGLAETPLAVALRMESGLSCYLPGYSSTEVLRALLEAGASPLVVDWEWHTHDLDDAGRRMLRSWSGWWRCRNLAWARSRGDSDMLRGFAPELLAAIGQFM